MNNQKEESNFGKPQPNDSHGDSENGQAHDIDVVRSYDSDIGNSDDRSTEIREKEHKELAIDFNHSVSEINRTENSQERKMTKEENIDNPRSEEGDEGTIYNRPIEKELMGIKSDLPEEDDIIGEDQPDGIKKVMIKAAKEIACGLKPKTKDEDKTPYSKHVKDKYAVPPETGSIESNFERGMPPTDTGQEFDERLSYRRAVSAGTIQRMKETHIKSSKHTSHTVPVALNEIEMYEPNVSNTNISQPTETPTIADDDSEDVYNFNHPMRGYMVIIVNDRFKHQPFRDGAECDLRHMKEMARKLGYRIQNTHFCQNLTQSETIGVLKNAKTADHSQCDSFALMISTHGLEQPNSKAKGKMDHALVCADDKMIFTSTITEMFNDENCPTLKGKPKLFFIQACRGENLDSGSTIRVLAGKSTADRKRGKSTDPHDHPRHPPLDESDVTGRGDTWAASSSGGLWSPPTIQTINIPHIHQVTEHVPTIAPSMTEPLKHHDKVSVGHTSRHLPRAPDVKPFPIVDTPSLQCENDQLVFFAIPPGMFAWRNTVDGSWMISYMYTRLMSLQATRPINLLSLLTKVSAQMASRTTNVPSNSKLHEKMAISVIEHRLTKDVIFTQKVPMSSWQRDEKNHPFFY